MAASRDASDFEEGRCVGSWCRDPYVQLRADPSYLVLKLSRKTCFGSKKTFLHPRSVLPLQILFLRRRNNADFDICVDALAHDGRPPLRPRPEGMPHHDFYRWPGAREPTSFLGLYSDELHNLVINGTLEFNPHARLSSFEVLQCVVVEVELGVASDMGWEPLLGPNFSAKTYDENGVTENTTVSSDESPRGVDPMSLREVDQMPYCDPMVYASCC